MNSYKVLSYYFSSIDIEAISKEIDLDFNSVEEICVLISKYFAEEFEEGTGKDPFDGEKDKIEKLLDKDNIVKLCKNIDERNNLGIPKNALVVTKALLVINEKAKSNVYADELKYEVNVNNENENAVVQQTEIEENVEEENEATNQEKEVVIEDTNNKETTNEQQTEVDFDDEINEEEYYQPKEKNVLDIILIVLIVILVIMIGIVLYKGIANKIF